MNKFLSRYLIYYPTTILKGEFVYAYLSKYKKFQYLAKDIIQDYSQHQLKILLRHAIKNSRYYRDCINYDPYLAYDYKEFYSNFHNLPFLTKKQLISHKSEINTYYSKWSSAKTTGGSTGEPVTIMKNPSALARERAATWRCYEWAGVSIGDKQARFWGVPHNNQERVKAKLTDFVANRRRISAFNLSEEALLSYYKILINYRPHYLYGYVTVIEEFARYIKENNLPPIPSLKSIITTSEVLSNSARDYIRSVFGVKIFNEYGCGEVGSIAHECEYGNMHIVADNLYLEIDGNGESGEIVVTDYFNFATPLIRYKVGDFATVDHGECACGRTLPMLKGIHGRAYDMIHTSDGSSLHPEAIMYIFEAIQKKSGSFKQFQAIQEDLDSFVINIVPTKHWSEGVQYEIEASLKKHISQDIKTRFNLVDLIPREKSGKMRVIKSLVNVET
jgi:phenylacetate-CoA ligase